MKDVSVEGRRYVVCLNPDQAEKDRADREAILASLEDALKKGPKALVGNKGYGRYLRIAPGSVEIFPREDRGGGAVRRQVRSECPSRQAPRNRPRRRTGHPFAALHAGRRVTPICEPVSSPPSRPPPPTPSPAGLPEWTPRTNLDLDAGEVAVKYRQLRRVERAFRTVKPVLETRPVYHECDETIGLISQEPPVVRIPLRRSVSRGR